MKNLNKILGGITVVLALIGAAAVVFPPGKKRSGAVKQTELLNHSYKDTVSEFTIADGSRELTLKKDGDTSGWIGESDGAVFPADATKISLLITVFTKFRSMYTVSYTGSYAPFFKETITISYRIDERLYTNVDFGVQNSDQTRRYLTYSDSNSNKKVIYETDDDFSSLLTTDSSYWGDPYLITGGAPSAQSAGGIQRISVYDRGSSLHFIAGSEKFKQAADGLLELRHGRILPKSLSKNSPDYILTVEYGNGTQLTVSFTENSTGTVTVSYPSEKAYSWETQISRWTFAQMKTQCSKF